MKKVRFFICLILCLGLVFGSALPSFASSDVTQSWLASQFQQYFRTDQAYYLTGTNGNSTTISIYSSLIKVLAMFAGNNSEHLYHLSQLITTTNSRLTSVIGYIDGVEGYIDGVESTLTNIYNKLPSSSWFTNITGYVDGLEGYVDGLETAMSTNNSRLSSILSAIQNLATDFGLETSQGYFWTKYDGSQSTITQGTSITDLLGMLGGAQGENLNGIYNNNLLIKDNTNSLVSRVGDYLPVSLKLPRRTNIITNPTSSNLYPTSIPRYRSEDSALGQYGFEVSTTNNPSVMGFLSNSNLISNFTLSKLFTVWTPYYIRSLNSDFEWENVLIDDKRVSYLSLADIFYDFYSAWTVRLAKMQYSIADDDTIQRKKDSALLTSGALDQVTGSGAAAASLSDFTSVSSGLGDIKSSVSGGASASSAFAVLNGGSNAWDWFSEDTQNDLDTTSGSSSSGSRSLKSVSSGSSSSTPFLDQYYSSVLSFLGGDPDD